MNTDTGTVRVAGTSAKPSSPGRLTGVTEALIRDYNDTRRRDPFMGMAQSTMLERPVYMATNSTYCSAVDALGAGKPRIERSEE